MNPQIIEPSRKRVKNSAALEEAAASIENVKKQLRKLESSLYKAKRAEARASATNQTKQAALLDLLIDTLDVKNDAALARALEFPPPVISKIRHGRLPVGAVILIRMHEVSGISIRKMKEYLPATRSSKW